MLVSRETAARTNRMIDVCGLDSLSIFLSARSAGAANLTYLFHHGVSEDAQRDYRDGGVFEDDPFPQMVDVGDRCGRLIRWGDSRLERAASRSRDYRQFINFHGISVVGAWVQQVLPHFHLVIGAHRRPAGRHRNEIPFEYLEHETSAISQMVVAQLFEETLAGARGRTMLNAVLDDAVAAEPVAGNISFGLSSRELQIARLVGEGAQNKQVAFAIGISEFTVENHLRRIYRKLNVRNRAAMTARLAGGFYLQ